MSPVSDRRDQEFSRSRFTIGTDGERIVENVARPAGSRKICGHRSDDRFLPEEIRCDLKIPHGHGETGHEIRLIAAAVVFEMPAGKGEGGSGSSVRDQSHHGPLRVPVPASARKRQLGLAAEGVVGSHAILKHLIIAGCSLCNLE